MVLRGENVLRATADLLPDGAEANRVLSEASMALSRESLLLGSQGRRNPWFTATLVGDRVAGSTTEWHATQVANVNEDVPVLVYQPTTLGAMLLAAGCGMNTERDIETFTEAQADPLSRRVPPCVAHWNDVALGLSRRAVRRPESGQQMASRRIRALRSCLSRAPGNARRMMRREAERLPARTSLLTAGPRRATYHVQCAQLVRGISDRNATAAGGASRYVRNGLERVGGVKEPDCASAGCLAPASPILISESTRVRCRVDERRS